MQVEAEAAAPGDIGAKGARGVAIAGLVVAVSGIAVQIVSSHTLSTADNTQFLTFWSLLFLVLGITGGMQNESTRAVRASFRSADAEGGVRADTGARIVPVGLVMGLGLAAAVVATSPLWADRVLQDYAALGTALVACATVAFSGHASVTGVLAGLGRWRTYSPVVGSEATLRLLLVGLVAALGATLAGYLWASALATGAWLLAFAASARTRSTFGARADRPLRLYVFGAGHAMLAAASTAVLVVGFPVAISLTTDPAAYREAAPLILAISLTRAPLLLPLNAFQGVAISHFVAHPEHRGRTLLRIVAVIAAVGVVGAVLAALLGPWALRILTTYTLDRWLFAALTVAGAILALLTLTGTAVLALGHHRAYSAGWVSGTAAAVLLLFLPLPLDQRVVLGLVLGPLVGIVVHAVVLLGSRGERSVG